MIEPAREIFAFVERQAEPIRGGLLFPVIAGISFGSLVPASAFAERARDFLDVSPLLSFYRCVAAIGAMDFSLAAPTTKIEDLLANVDPRALEHPSVKTHLLQAPLNRKYLELAQTDWSTLRGSTLSHAALHVYLAKQAPGWASELLGE